MIRLESFSMLIIDSPVKGISNVSPCKRLTSTVSAEGKLCTSLKQFRLHHYFRQYKLPSQLIQNDKTHPDQEDGNSLFFTKIVLPRRRLRRSLCHSQTLKSTGTRFLGRISISSSNKFTRHTPEAPHTLYRADQAIQV